jgi:hypothetical protein
MRVAFELVDFRNLTDPISTSELDETQVPMGTLGILVDPCKDALWVTPAGSGDELSDEKTRWPRRWCSRGCWVRDGAGKISTFWTFS